MIVRIAYYLTLLKQIDSNVNLEEEVQICKRNYLKQWLLSYNEGKWEKNTEIWEGSFFPKEKKKLSQELKEFMKHGSYKRDRYC